jgi:uncharacterized protein (DUF1778 family)
MTDTSPEALDALEKRLRRTPLYEGSGEGSDLPEEAADTIAALRAALVAMREADALEAAVHSALDGPPRSWAALNRRVRAAIIGWRVRKEAAAALPLNAPAPVDPVANGEWTEERFRAVMATLPKPTMTSEEITALTRADAPPTLAEAMTVPEVRAMAGLLEMMDAAIENSVTNLSGDLVFRMADGWHSVASLRTSIRATLARLKGGTP